MSKIKFDTLCGATVEVDPRMVVSIHFPYGDRYTITDRGLEIGTGQIVLDCGSHFIVDADTFWQIARAVANYQSSSGLSGI